SCAPGARAQARPTPRNPRRRGPPGDRDRRHPDATQEAGQGHSRGTKHRVAGADGGRGSRNPGTYSTLKAADTSLVVAAFASWHENHENARRALDGGLRLIEHCALETYSVLTRLPAPHRSAGLVVREFLQTRFPPPFLRLDARAYRDFVLGLPDHGIT